MSNRETYTLDADGQALSVERDDCSAPADYSFACVNDYVHAPDRHFEELQYLALGMSGEIEKLTKALRHVCELYCVDDYYIGAMRDKEIARAVNDALESVMPTCKRDKKPCGGDGGYCLECPSGPRREWLSK